MTINALFVQSNPARRRYGVATLVGFATGIMSAFVKWGAEVPLPPRTITDGRAEFNPPYLFYVIILASIQPRRCIRSQNILLIQ